MCPEEGITDMRVPVITGADAFSARTAPPRPTTPAKATKIAAVRTALPPHRYAQDDLTEPIGDLCLPPGADRAVLRRLHASAGVRTRHLTLPIERYSDLRDFGQCNDAWMAAGLELGEEALTGALQDAGLEPTDVDLLVCASITGIGAPSLDARLAGRVGLRPDVKRLPVFGLGCVAGAAGLSRVHDYLRGHPDDTAVLLTVELCSLTLQQRDHSPPTSSPAPCSATARQHSLHAAATAPPAPPPSRATPALSGRDAQPAVSGHGTAPGMGHRRQRVPRRDRRRCPWHRAGPLRPAPARVPG